MTPTPGWEGPRLAEAREARGLTQAQLAEAVGVARAQIGQWETNVRTPGADSLVKLARALEVSTDHILGLEE